MGVLTRREIANQEKSTFEEQKDAQTVRIDLEKARGTADMQAALAQAQVSVDINRARADARKAEADGEAAATEALGLARAKGYDAQVQSLGSAPTAAVAIANAVSEGRLQVVPDVLVTGGGAVDGLAATLMRAMNGGNAPNPRDRRTPRPATPVKTPKLESEKDR